MTELSVRPTQSSSAARRGGRRTRPARTRRVHRAEQFPTPVTLSLPILGVHWQSALDAAQAALAAARTLPPEELRGRRARLDTERLAAARLLEGVARDHNLTAHFAYLTTPTRELRRLLGLPDRIDACVFTLDGVLVGSAAVHAAAWEETFDAFLLGRGQQADRPFRPFDPNGDYYRHIHARPRLEGVRSFLESRGISLPEGEAGDSADRATVHGLANRKAAALLRRLDAHPLAAYAGSRQYLEAARAAHVRRVVVSASANARPMLDRAGLAGLVDDCVDGSAMVAERLRPKPAPDTLLAACRRVGVAPQDAAAFETTESGVAAARAAGFALVVGVAANADAQALRAAGADQVLGALADLLAEELAA